MSTDDLDRLPGVREQVQVRSSCCDGEPHLSRVLNVVPGRLVLAAPILHPGRSTAVRAGEPVVVRWLADTPVERPTEVEDLLAGPPAAWVLAPTDAAVRVQRREYVRLQTNGTMTVSGGNSDRAGTEVQLLDISEGGVRFLVEGGGFTIGERLSAVLELDGYAIQCAGEVARVRRVDGTRFELGLKFVHVARGGSDRIRRHVFTIQRSRSVLA